MKNLLRVGVVSLITVVSLTSCQTPKPAIVRQVELAPTPVAGVVIAHDHMIGLLDTMEVKLARVQSPEQLIAFAGNLEDSLQAFDVALRRLMTIDTVTPAEDAKLKAMLNQAAQKKDMERFDRAGKLLERANEKHGGTEALAYRGVGILYWIGRCEESLKRLQSKPFTVR